MINSNNIEVSLTPSIILNTDLSIGKGPQGEKGDKGQDGTVTFEELTPTQIEMLKGPKGDTGLQGIQGIKGATGSQGIQGIQGPKGDIGATGPQGIQGIQGLPGTVNINDSNISTSSTYSSNKINSDITLINNNLGKTTNTKYVTVNGTKEFICKDGYVDNIAIAGQTKILDANNNVVVPGTAGAKIVSIGQGDKIEVLSIQNNKSNKIDLSSVTWKDGYYLQYTGVEVQSSMHSYTQSYISIGESDCLIIEKGNPHICFYDANKNYIPTNISYYTETFELVVSNIPKNAKYVRFTISLQNKGNIVSFLSKYDKKQISTTLRSLPNGVKDEIVKQGDKYYKIQRCGEIVLNGGENWITPWGETSTGLFKAYIPNFPSDIKSSADSNSLANVYCDKFPNNTAISLYISSNTKEGITLGHSGNKEICICVLKSKLATQDLAGFKAWSANNPITVVYELATPIITEIPNPNPRTFGDKTTLLLNSGVVQSEASFEVTNSLGSDIEVMKDKISSLDNDIITDAFKTIDIIPYNGVSVTGNNVCRLNNFKNYSVFVADLISSTNIPSGTTLLKIPNLRFANFPVYTYGSDGKIYKCWLYGDGKITSFGMIIPANIAFTFNIPLNTNI